MAAHEVTKYNTIILFIMMQDARRIGSVLTTAPGRCKNSETKVDHGQRPDALDWSPDGRNGE